MNQKTLTRNLVFTAMLAAVAGVLMSLEISVPFMPVFYKFDFSDVPAIIAVFLMGPIWGAAVEVIKIAVKLVQVGTSTAYVGEFANLISIIFFVVPIWYFYKKLGKTLKAAVVALAVSAVFRTIMACGINAFISLPIYARAMGTTLNDVVMMVSKANPYIKNLPTFLILATVPFNLIKIGINSLVGYSIYEILVKAHVLNMFAPANAAASAQAAAENTETELEAGAEA